MERGMSGRGHKGTFWADGNYIVIGFAYLGLVVSQSCTTKICCTSMYIHFYTNNVEKYNQVRGGEWVEVKKK